MSTHSGCYGRSHIGKVRTENEDSFLIEYWPTQSAAIVVVADGMGSYGGGATAAMAVTETFAELVSKPLPHSRNARYELLLGAFYHADAKIKWLQDTSNPEMGATVAAAIVTEDELMYLYAGDCRVYHFSRDGETFISRDHSVTRALLDAGKIDQDEAARHPMGSVVTSCLGGPPLTSRITIDPQYADGLSSDDENSGPFRKLAHGDIIVLCCDGLWGEIADNSISVLVQRSRFYGQSAKQISSGLINLALDGPATDNITGIVIDADALYAEFAAREAEEDDRKAAMAAIDDED